MTLRWKLWLPCMATLALAGYVLYSFSMKAQAMRPKSYLQEKRQALHSRNPQGQARDSQFVAALAADTLVPPSPFGRPNPPRPKPRLSANAKPTWMRPNYVLKGTVGDQAATLVNSRGEKFILRVGESVDSARLLSIQPGRVTLRDAHGTFVIEVQE